MHPTIINKRHLLVNLFFLIYAFCLISCGEKPVSRRSIKVITPDTSSFLYDATGKLSDNTRQLFNAIESSDPKCNYTYVLDPTFIRADIGLEFSIATKIEQSGIGDNTNPNRIIKLVKQNLDELKIDPSFLRGTVAQNKNTDSLYTNFVASRTAKDSVLVFRDKTGPDSLIVNGKRYKILTTKEEVKDKIISILCENEKATLALLINPPVVTIPKPIPPGVPEEPKGPVSMTQSSPARKPVVSHTASSKVARTDNGDLSMVKNSEGCDVCTRYYSATDKLGRVRQVTERNSTFCCPCGKTIEMKGRTYRMECDGASNNRLSLVE